MRTLVQDTSSSSDMPLPFEIRFGSPHRKDGVTYGGYVEGMGLDVGLDTQSLESALTLALELEAGEELATTVRSLVSVLVEAFEAHYGIASELPPIPPLYVYRVENGSIMMEWISDHFRAGIGVGPTVQESSWYLVSDESLDGFNGSGLLNPDNIRSTVFGLVSFVLANS